MSRLPKSNILRFLIRNANSRNNPIHDQTRRDFLKQVASRSVMLGAGLQWACSSRVNPLLKGITSKNARVVIVGAGLAGLECAYVLKKAGIYAKMYEGSNRVGGRVSTGQNLVVESSWCDLGGEFFDSNHTAALERIKSLGLELMDTQSDLIVEKETFFIDGHAYDAATVLQEFKRISPKIVSDAQACGADYDTDRAKTLDRTSLEEYVSKLDCETWMKILLTTSYVAEFGLEAGIQSSLNFISMLGTPATDHFEMFGESDERFKLKGGSQSLTNALQADLTKQIEVLHRLTAIKSEAGGYTLTFENAKTVKADFVVMTIPFTTLRNVQLDLEGMTPEKKKCISDLTYGQNNKLLLGFKSRIWRDSEQKKAGYLFHNLIQNGWDHTHMQRQNQGSGGYTVFLGGKAALALESYTSQAPKVISKYLHALNEAFPGTKKDYAAKYSAALWTKNPWVMGSYSAYKTGHWTSIAGQEIAPIGNVLFAGEHCSSNFQGYMNGAIETGRLAAQSIVKKLS